MTYVKDSYVCLSYYLLKFFDQTKAEIVNKLNYLLEHCGSIINMQGSIFLSLFLGGLLGSLNHCVGMCSPFVLAQISTHKNDAPILLLQKISNASLVPYHFGRITTYVFFSVLVSLFSFQIIGSYFGQFMIALLLAGAGIIFIMNAFPQISLKFKNVKVFDVASAMSVIINPLSKNKGYLARYFLGIVLGFLPCGLVFAALMLTVTIGNITLSALGMMLFGLGTVPALFAVAFLGQTFFKKCQKNFIKISQIIMTFNGLTLLFMAIQKIILI